jgi:hypothetical protein
LPVQSLSLSLFPPPSLSLLSPLLLHRCDLHGALVLALQQSLFRALVAGSNTWALLQDPPRLLLVKKRLLFDLPQTRIASLTCMLRHIYFIFILRILPSVVWRTSVRCL